VKYDLALYPAPGPGLGHLMRCLALAQWAVELKAKVLVALREPTAIAWPCAVLCDYEVEPEASVSVIDGTGTAEPAVNVWAIVDELPGAHNAITGFIYPHFGAEPVPGYPTFVGPSWMPLRREFSSGPWTVPGGRSDWACSYRAQREGYRDIAGHSACWELLGQANHALVPASTIAYEALALGCPIRLLRGITPDCDRIGTAMVAEGVAVWDDEAVATLPPMQIGDGLGAKRLLEALL